VHLRAFLAAALLTLCTTTWAVKSGPVRRVPLQLIVIHTTGGPVCDAAGRPAWVGAGSLRENIATIEAHPRLGIHYMIDRDGTTVSSVPEGRIAHHVFRHSEASIAVELVNDGDGVDPFPPAQLDALVELLRGLVQRHRLAPAAVKRHSELDFGRLPCAPERRRKVDPGRAFPMQEVLRRVYERP
jgi:N-acetyl-anhydromuramyl-L-alanine amidase AmpD